MGSDGSVHNILQKQLNQKIYTTRASDDGHDDLMLKIYTVIFAGTYPEQTN